MIKKNQMSSENRLAQEILPLPQPFPVPIQSHWNPPAWTTPAWTTTNNPALSLTPQDPSPLSIASLNIIYQNLSL